MPLRAIARFVMSVSSTSGVLVGLIAGVGGSLFTDSRAALAEFAANTFLLLLVALPVVFYIRLLREAALRALGYRLAVAAWLPIMFLAFVSFMIPVVMTPIVFGRGVTLDNSADWYREVYHQILGWRLLLVAALTLVGCGVAVYSARPAAENV